MRPRALRLLLTAVRLALLPRTTSKFVCQCDVHAHPTGYWSLALIASPARIPLNIGAVCAGCAGAAARPPCLRQRLVLLVVLEVLLGWELLPLQPFLRSQLLLVQVRVRACAVVVPHPEDASGLLACARRAALQLSHLRQWDGRDRPHMPILTRAGLACARRSRSFYGSSYSSYRQRYYGSRSCESRPPRIL